MLDKNKICDILVFVGCYETPIIKKFLGGNMKKVLSILIAIMLVGSVFVSCSKKTEPKEVVTLKVWGAQEDQAMLAEMVEEFKAANTEKEYNITFGVVGEGDAKTKVMEDPAAAGDVFAMAHDQLGELVDAGAVYKITRNADAIKAANDKASVDASTVDGQLYAYPMTSDNGYFMYYDKGFFTEDDVKSMETMLEKAAAADKYVNFDLANSWYVAGWFFANGCTMNMTESTFNTPAGYAVAETFKAISAHPGMLNGNGDVMKGGFGTNVVAGVSGTWDAAAVQELLGDNYAATKLPTIKIDGKDTQMGSFAGCKLMAVNSQTAFPVDAMELAEWLTNEANQIKRFETRELGPSNVNAQAADAVKANVALAALAAQAPYAVIQNDVPGTYWGPAGAFGASMANKDYTGTPAEMVDQMVEQIYAQ